MKTREGQNLSRLLYFGQTERGAFLPFSPSPALPFSLAASQLQTSLGAFKFGFSGVESVSVAAGQGR